MTRRAVSLERTAPRACGPGPSNWVGLRRGAGGKLGRTQARGRRQSGTPAPPHSALRASMMPLTRA